MAKEGRADIEPTELEVRQNRAALVRQAHVHPYFKVTPLIADSTRLLDSTVRMAPHAPSGARAPSSTRPCSARRSGTSATSHPRGGASSSSSNRASSVAGRRVPGGGPDPACRRACA